MRSWFSVKFFLSQMLCELVMTVIERLYFSLSSSQHWAGGGGACWGQCSEVVSQHSQIAQVVQPCFPKERGFWPFRMVWNLVWVITTVYSFRTTFALLFALASLLYEPAVWINDPVIITHADSDAFVFSGGYAGFYFKVCRANLPKTLMLPVRIPETCFGIRKFPFGTG